MQTLKKFVQNSRKNLEKLNISDWGVVAYSVETPGQQEVFNVNNLKMDLRNCAKFKQLFTYFQIGIL